MSNPMVTFQLADVYDQLVVARVLAPPLGFKPFKPKFRTMYHLQSLEVKIPVKHGVKTLICPACLAPKNQQDSYGWVWIIGGDEPLMEGGHNQQCRICFAIVWSDHSWVFHEQAPFTAYFKPMPKGIRHEPARHVAANGAL